MPIFTIETTYRLPIYRHRTYEAPTFEDACRLAIEDDDWEGSNEDHDSAGATYITGAWSGEEAYCGDVLPVPQSMASEFQVGGLPAHSSVSAARAAIDAHNAALRLEDGNSRETDIWHVVRSLIEYSEAHAVDFNAVVADVRRDMVEGSVG